MKIPTVLVGLIVAPLICSAGNDSGQEKKRIWGRSYIVESVGDNRDTLLEGLHVTQGPEHLMGVFHLSRQREGAQLLILGHLNKAGEFVPNVSLEVSNRQDGGWTTIESSVSDKVDITFTAAPHVQKLYPRVQLDAFQPYIGKFKYCRVSLQTGESDVFPMIWLTEKGE